MTTDMMKDEQSSSSLSDWFLACCPLSLWSSSTHLPPSASLSPPRSPLLSALAPVRLLFHPLLTDEDAARLLRVSKSFAKSLLPSYTFTQHPFAPRSEHDLWTLNALCDAYGLRITRMCLPRDLKRLDLEKETGHSPLPPSLITLALGERVDRQSPRLSIFSDEATARLLHGFDLPWRDPLSHRTVADLQWKLRNGCLWPDFHFSGVDGCLGRHLPHSLLPRGLRILQFGDQFDSPIEAHVLPPTLEYLHMGSSFAHPLTEGVLPPSLIHLVLGSSWNHPIIPQLLPPLLQCLQLGQRFNRAIAQHALPHSLRVLELGADMVQPLRPSVLPPFLTHLRLYGVSGYPLIPGLIPQVLVSLDLFVHGIEPLRPGVLPASLRDLGIGPLFGQPLMPGSLPEGLELLRIDDRNYSHPLGVGVIPKGVRALDLAMAPGVMAFTVLPLKIRWLRVRMKCRAVVSAMSLPVAQIEWHQW